MIKSEAAKRGLDPYVLDRDHAQGVVLWSLASSSSGWPRWVFKGGTCLRKAYFPDYRFSEDLDFTVVASTDEGDVRRRLAAIEPLASGQGVHLDLPVARSERAGDTLEVRVPYRGAVRLGGSPASLQFHLTVDEPLAFEPVDRPLAHEYPDSRELECRIACYSVEEVLAEKLRAVCGQRRYAIGRDIYDIWQLALRGADVGSALGALPQKAAAKSLSLEGCLEHVDSRRDEYSANWDYSMPSLVADLPESAFEEAWANVHGIVKRIG